MTMHFLGIYNLAAVLAIVGTCCASDGARAGEFHDGGGDLLPPPAYVINAPVSDADNGYNPTYYWNRYAAYAPPSPALGYAVSYPPAYWRAGGGYARWAAAHRSRNGQDDVGDDGGSFGGDTAAIAGTDGGDRADRHHQARRHRRHDQARGTPRNNVREMEIPPLEERTDNRPAVAQTVEAAPHPQADHRDHRGYNGHDAHMFEGQTATPVAAKY